ncbi:protein FAM117A isoform X1 [Corythoichthys intestinalis]|uniref:protein FAM117A isoform X1 n=1 Tax=Corythoichthys intestinalis TaxID=161448 RepID=UPI0025A60D60|nr:protein FAM117A isoform X1 [Corythoichthys intestinalis]XP_061804883.1 protein FAM117A-like [Nerophis lumbriciformis]
MSGRSGAAPRGCSNPNVPLLPLRATVPYQMLLKTAERTSARPPRPTMRRTLSLDAILAPYLQGQWPKEPKKSPSGSCVCDKATQTPSCWAEETQNRRSFGGHKRSASWGSAEHLKEVAKLRQQLQKRSRHAAPSAAGYEPSHHALTTGVTQTSPLVPLSRLASRLRRSVEGLNLELEEVFVSENRDDQHEHLDIPDGHRAPAPVQRCSSGSQSESSPGPLDLSLLSPSQSPCPLDPSLLSPSTSPCPLNPLLFSPTQSPESATREVLCPSPSTFFPSYGVDPPVLPPCSTSSFSSPPCLDQSLFFKRQPPEGSEPLPMCQDTMLACPNELLNLQPSCPDLNKVNFTPHGGSAFCPVSLLKPLLPSMDLLFRGLSVSPVTGCPEQVSPTRQLGMQ